jgi:HK97 gp10 family phage protein
MALSITISIPKLPKVVYALSGASTVIRKHIESSIRQQLNAIEGRVKITAPVDTGQLRSRWMREITPMRGTLRSLTPYAIYVHEGTGIYAKSGSRAKKIPWVYQSKGRFYTTHGQKAQPFLDEAVDETMGLRKSIFEKEMNNAMSEVARNAK